MSDETQGHPVRFGRTIVAADGTRRGVHPLADLAYWDTCRDPADIAAYLDGVTACFDNADDNGTNPYTVTRLDRDASAHGAAAHDGDEDRDGHHEPDDHS